MKRKSIIMLVLAAMLVALALPAGLASAGPKPDPTLTGHWHGTYTSNREPEHPVYAMEWDLVETSPTTLDGSSTLTLPDGNTHIFVKKTPGTIDGNKVVLDSTIILHVLDPILPTPADMELKTTNDLTANSEKTHMQGTAEMRMTYSWMINDELVDDGNVVLDKVSSSSRADGDLLGPWRGTVQSWNPAGTYSMYMNCISDVGGKFVAKPVKLDNPDLTVTVDRQEGTHVGDDVKMNILIELPTKYAGVVKLDIRMKGTYKKGTFKPRFTWDSIEDGTYKIISTMFGFLEVRVDEGDFLLKKILAIAYPL